MLRLLICLLSLFVIESYGQRYELYAGAASNNDKVLKVGYMAGFNFIMDMNQRADREWANRMLFGMEHSGFYSDNIYLSSEIDEGRFVSNDCDCETEDINGEEAFNEDRYMKRYARGVSLNFGIEAYKGFYLLTGVTTYNHITTLDRIKVLQNRSTSIDFGVKYYIKHNNWYFSPTIKFNPEQISYGVGVSWNHL